MEIFKIKFGKRGKAKDEFVGFHMSEPMVNLLRLYSTAKGLSTSRVIRNTLLEWLKDYEEVSLLQEVSATAQAEWKNIKKDKIMSFDTFKKSVRAELRKKRLTPMQIKAIINRLKS